MGHFITDNDDLYISLEIDIEERATNVHVKFRNFVNNNKNVPLKIRLKVFQTCFCSVVLSNCEIWGRRIPKKVRVLYHQGIKLALGVRNCTPTALVFLESRQQAVLAIIRKRQLKFWRNLSKEEGTELHNLIERATDTDYITHYKNLQGKFEPPRHAYNEINSKFFLDKWNEIKQAIPDKTKMRLYHEIYSKEETLPQHSLSLKSSN